MRKLLTLLLLLASFASIAEAGIITRPTKTTGGTSYTDGTVPHDSDLNGDIDTVYSLVNGNIEDANIKAGANISASKILTNFTSNLQVTTASAPCFVNIDSSRGADLKQWRLCQNAGVLSIATFTDAGAIIITPLSIARATGIITLTGGLVLSTGNLTLSNGHVLLSNGTLTLTSLTAKSFIYTGAGGLFSATAAPTNGQMLIGSTGNVPVVGTITGTATHICTTLGAGTFALDFCANPALASPVISGTVSGGATHNGITIDTSSQLTGTGSSVLGIAANKQLRGVIYGFTYANNGAQNLDIATGGAMDSAGQFWIETAALTKQTNVSWVVGTNQGCLDTGVVGDSDYYIWTIVRTDTLVTDYLCSLSSTAPTMPASYTRSRLIGWYKRSAGVVVAFLTYETMGGGLEFLWSVPTLDINLANTLTTTRRTDAIKVPLNLSTIAHLNVSLNDTVQSTAFIYCPDIPDIAPSLTTSPLGNAMTEQTGSTGVNQEIHVRTSATGTIAARATTATIDVYRVSTIGFTWARRN